MKNLSEHTINDLGFNTIRESLADLARCEKNYSFFKNIIPSIDSDEIEEHNNFTDSIY